MLLKLFLILGALSPAWAAAETFKLPLPGNEIIGEILHTQAKQEDTLIDIAREFSLGQDEIVMANPHVDRWLPKAGTEVLVPHQFILPEAPHSGIVVNIPEMRLYYYQGGSIIPPVKGKAPVQTAPSQIISYPISIGRMDWRTPLGMTRIMSKVKDPTWTPPETIKQEHAKDGDFLPDVVPAGPNNPLGQFAMKLGVPGYLIHGTGIDKAFGIGMRVTHGCIRMYPEDIAQLFPLVKEGTPVNLVNQPIKLGWMNGVLYIEVSQPLDEDRMTYDQLLEEAMRLIELKTRQHKVILDGAILKRALQEPSGIPVAISKTGEAVNNAPSMF